MSRIGKKPISIPKNVKVNITDKTAKDDSANKDEDSPFPPVETCDDHLVPAAGGGQTVTDGRTTATGHVAWCSTA